MECTVLECLIFSAMVTSLPLFLIDKNVFLIYHDIITKKFLLCSSVLLMLFYQIPYLCLSGNQPIELFILLCYNISYHGGTKCYLERLLASRPTLG